MKTSIVYAAVLASMSLTLPACAVQDQAIRDDDMGLSKTSVYDNPAPDLIEWTDMGPGSVGKRAERSYMTAPPMIPHSTDGLLPITQDSNMCKDCHVQPDMIGQKVEPGVPIPAPASHYQDVKAGQLYMGRWTCTQCHNEQAKVNVLVESTFDKAVKK